MNHAFRIFRQKISLLDKLSRGATDLLDKIASIFVTFFDREPRISSLAPLGFCLGEWNEGAEQSHQLIFGQPSGTQIPTRIRAHGNLYGRKANAREIVAVDIDSGNQDRVRACPGSPGGGGGRFSPAEC